MVELFDIVRRKRAALLRAVMPTTAALFMLLCFGMGATALPAPSGQNVWTSNGPFTGIQALAIDPSSPQTVYAGTGGSPGMFKSTNGGDSWTTVNAGLTNTQVYALAIGPSSPQTVYAGTDGGGVFKSTNGGSSWTAVNSGLTNTLVRALAIGPSSPQTVYAGTDGGGVFKSTNGGGSWTAANSELPTNPLVKALAIDPSSTQTVYVGMGEGVARSMNGGGSWTAVHSGLTSKDVRALAIDPLNSQTVYAGTGGGVFVITFSRTGVAPTISLSTSSLAFGDVQVGQSKALTFTVSNTGNAALNVISITVTGTDASQFTVNPAWCWRDKTHNQWLSAKPRFSLKT